MRQRIAVLIVTLGVALAANARVSADDPPRRRARPTPAQRIRGEVAALVSAVARDGGAQLAYARGTSSLNVIRGRAWFLTVAVRDAPAYGGEYFVLSWIDGRRIGELLHGPGQTRAYEGEELATFLAAVELDDGPVQGAFERWFGGPPQVTPAPVTSPSRSF